MKFNEICATQNAYIEKEVVQVSGFDSSWLLRKSSLKIFQIFQIFHSVSTNLQKNVSYFQIIRSKRMPNSGDSGPIALCGEIGGPSK